MFTVLVLYIVKLNLEAQLWEPDPLDGDGTSMAGRIRSALSVTIVSRTREDPVAHSVSTKPSEIESRSTPVSSA